MVNINLRFFIFSLAVFHSTLLKVCLSAPSPEIFVFLRWPLDSTIHAAVDIQEMVEREFQSRSEITSFSCLLRTLDDGTFCEPGTQQLWQELRIALGLQHRRKAAVRVRNIFRKRFIFQIPAFFHQRWQVWSAPRGYLFIHSDFGLAGHILPFIVEHSKLIFEVIIFSFSFPSCNGKEDT